MVAEEFKSEVREITRDAKITLVGDVVGYESVSNFSRFHILTDNKGMQVLADMFCVEPRREEMIDPRERLPSELVPHVNGVCKQVDILDVNVVDYELKAYRFVSNEDLAREG